MRTTRGIVIGIFSILALVGAGCAKRAVVQQEPVAPRAESPADANRNASEEEEDREPSEDIFGARERQVPSNFPSDVPRKPGAVFVDAKEAGGIIVTAAFRGTGTVTEWTTYYKQALVAAGWSIQESYTVNDVTLIKAVKSQRTITMTISKNEDNPQEIAAAMMFGVAVPQPSFPRAPEGSVQW